MSVIDIIILIILVLALIKGIKDGFVRQIAGIIALLLGIWLAYKFSGWLTGIISGWIDTSEQIIKIVSFAIILIVVIVAVNLLGRLIEKILSVSMLGWLNRLLGVIFSLVACALILGVVFSLLTYVNTTWFTIIPEDKISESQLFNPILNFSEAIFPYLKNFFKFSSLPL